MTREDHQLLKHTHTHKKTKIKSCQESGAHYLESPSPTLTLGVNSFPYIFIFITDLLQFLPGVFAPLHQLLHSDPLLLNNNNGEKQYSAPQEQCFPGKHVSKKRYGKG